MGANASWSRFSSEALRRPVFGLKLMPWSATTTNRVSPRCPRSRAFDHVADQRVGGAHLEQMALAVVDLGLRGLRLVLVLEGVVDIGRVDVALR